MLSIDTISDWQPVCYATAFISPPYKAPLIATIVAEPITLVQTANLRITLSFSTSQSWSVVRKSENTWEVNPSNTPQVLQGKTSLYKSRKIYSNFPQKILSGN